MHASGPQKAKVSGEGDVPQIVTGPADEFEIMVVNPEGPPSPARTPRTGLNALAGAFIVVATGASTIHMIGGSIHSCRGATRSAQLQWQLRQAEMQRMLDEQEVGQIAVESGALEDVQDAQGE